mgnify:CR=1 FL=1
MSESEEKRQDLECLNCGAKCNVKWKMEDEMHPIFCPFCGDEIIQVEFEDDYILEDEDFEDFDE